MGGVRIRAQATVATSVDALHASSLNDRDVGEHRRVSLRSGEGNVLGIGAAREAQMK